MFRNKKEGSGLEWFRIDVGATSLYGYKCIDGSMYLEIKYLDSTKCVKIDTECTDKLIDWMMRTYPRRPANVLRLVNNKSRLTNYVLPVFDTPPDTEGSPPSTK